MYKTFLTTCAIIFTILALFIFYTSDTKAQENVIYLGEGTGTYNLPVGYDVLIVKKFYPYEVEVLRQPSYTSWFEGTLTGHVERVWACVGDFCNHPTILFQSKVALQPGSKITTFILDDDTSEMGDERRPRLVDSEGNVIDTIESTGLAYLYTYTSEISGTTWLDSDDSIIIFPWLVEQTSTPTVKPTATPTATPSATPSATSTFTNESTATSTATSTSTFTAIPTLASTSTETLTPTATVNMATTTPTHTPTPTTEFTPTSTVTATTTNDSTSSDAPDSTATVEAPLFADVALRKTLKPLKDGQVLKRGDTVTFIIEVFNQGTMTATEVFVVDYVPDGLVFVKELNPKWHLTDKYSVALLEDLPPGNSVKVEITFIIVPTEDKSGRIYNYAEVRIAEDDIDSYGDMINGNGAGESEQMVDDAIDGTGGDEDDHDVAIVTILIPNRLPVVDLPLFTIYAPIVSK